MCLHEPLATHGRQCHQSCDSLDIAILDNGLVCHIQEGHGSKCVRTVRVVVTSVLCGIHFSCFTQITVWPFQHDFTGSSSSISVPAPFQFQFNYRFFFPRLSVILSPLRSLSLFFFSFFFFFFFSLFFFGSAGIWMPGSVRVPPSGYGIL